MKTIVKKGSVLLFLTLAMAFVENSEAVAAGDAALNFEKAKRELLSHFVVPSLTEDQLYQYALQGMLAGLNEKHPDWNHLYNPEEYEQLQQNLSGKAGCIGAKITLDPSGAVLVTGVLPNSPAEKEGMQAQDKIIQIEGEPVKGKNAFQSG